MSDGVPLTSTLENKTFFVSLSKISTLSPECKKWLSKVSMLLDASAVGCTISR